MHFLIALGCAALICLWVFFLMNTKESVSQPAIGLSSVVALSFYLMFGLKCFYQKSYCMQIRFLSLISCTCASTVALSCNPRKGKEKKANYYTRCLSYDDGIVVDAAVAAVATATTSVSATTYKRCHCNCGPADKDTGDNAAKHWWFRHCIQSSFSCWDAALPSWAALLVLLLLLLLTSELLLLLRFGLLSQVSIDLINFFLQFFQFRRTLLLVNVNWLHTHAHKHAYAHKREMQA